MKKHKKMTGALVFTLAVAAGAFMGTVTVVVADEAAGWNQCYWVQGEGCFECGSKSCEPPYDHCC